MLDSSASQPSILVTHPGRQHSHQLAVALHKANLLGEYWAGVPACRISRIPGLRAITSLLEKHALLPLPDEDVRHNLVSPLARRVFETVLPQSQAVDWTHRSMDWFDRWASNQLGNVDADSVVSYENAALHTFEAAKNRGWTTILDAASFHHIWQDRYFEYPESDSAHERIAARKDREIELADHIVTVSELACDSYIQAGISPSKVSAIPLGCDLELFTPLQNNRELEDKPFTFTFAGHARRIKGVDLLLEASARLDDQGHQHVLQFIGGYESSLPDSPCAEWLGHVAQPELAQYFRRADCVVLPSRVDSFGMVVVEAMAAGCPVIVSDQVGAKQAVTEGESGWVVPAEDTDALADRMQWCINHVDAVRSMADAAREDAAKYSWEAYRERVAQHLQSLLVSA